MTATVSPRSPSHAAPRDEPLEAASAHICVAGLHADDFRRIAVNGFNESENAYAHSMAFFRGHLYVGTSRHSLALLKLFPPPEPPAMEPWPVPVPERVQDLDLHGQIWRFDPEAERWDKVHTSPTVSGRDGEPVPRALAYRGMTVFQGESDPAAALYVGTISAQARCGPAQILRSLDGRSFAPVGAPGLGNPKISAFRSLQPFDGRLFVPPTGEGERLNSNRASTIYCTPNPASQSWEPACPPGFGDSTNGGIFDLAVFNDHLYAGTFNHTTGYQVWKTPATGGGPCHWRPVMTGGAGRGPLNEIAMSICAFRGALYVGSAVQNGGYDRVNHVGPAAAELVRIYPDDSWDLVVGSPRPTKDGMKYPLSGMGPGFDNVFAGYMWRMVEHDGWLYAATFDWSVFMPFAKRPSQAARHIAKQAGLDTVARSGGGFELWRSRDGVSWMPITRDGFGNACNYGGRTLASTPHGLFVGTANPFGPQVAARTPSGWTYVPNPNGGAEVWWAPNTGAHDRKPSTGRDAEIAERPPEPINGAGPQERTRPPLREVLGNVLVTGASGFIGSHLLERLLPSVGAVRVLALPETEIEIPADDRIELVTGDLAAEETLLEAVRGVNSVLHLGAMLPGASHADLMRVNVHGTENLVRACVTHGELRRFVLLSSVAVYGGPVRRAEWPYSENSPTRPGGGEDLRNYGMSKVAAERVLRKHARLNEYEYVILRASTAYGPRGRYVEDLIRDAQRQPSRDRRGDAIVMQLIHAADLSRAVILAASHPSAPAGEIFNVAGAEAPTHGDIRRLVSRLSRGDHRTRLVPSPTGSLERYIRPYEVTKIRDWLNFTPQVTITEGLTELVTRMQVEP